MRAVRLDAKGGPDDLRWATVSEPVAGEGQIRVKLAAAGVNFIDIYQRSGLYPVDFPFIPGLEGSGVVDQVGKGVTRWAVGDRVAWFSAPGSYAEFAVVDAENAVTVPSDVDLEIAAASMLQGITAEYLVRDAHCLQAGQTCLVHAGAGGVGRLLIQMAVHAGARVFATAGTMEKQQIARDLGAEIVSGYDDFVDVVQEVVGSRPVDVVYDGVGQATFAGDLRVMRRFGTIVLFGQSSGPVAPLDLQDLSRNGSLFVTRPTIFHYAAAREDLERYTADVFEAIREGWLDVLVGGRYPMDEAGDAHRALEARETTGKLLLVPPGA
ncbi:MAG: quinone oxidoreductase [Acidimicrobiia bacterium]